MSFDKQQDLIVRAVVVQLLQQERRRQLTARGFGEDHDDLHDGGQLARAAACYAVGYPIRQFAGFMHSGASAQSESVRVHDVWPWSTHNWSKETNRPRALVKAGALIIAEIERLMRAWLEELKSLAVSEFGYSQESAHSLDTAAYLEYFIAGHTPKEALAEDAQSA